MQISDLQRDLACLTVVSIHCIVQLNGAHQVIYTFPIIIRTQAYYIIFYLFLELR